VFWSGRRPRMRGCLPDPGPQPEVSRRDHAAGRTDDIQAVSRCPQQSAGTDRPP